MKTLINFADLTNWIDSHAVGNDAHIEAIAEFIHNDPDRPNYGDDWTEYLDSLPENLSELEAENYGLKSA